MKKFKYNLETVLRIRNRAVDEETRKLALVVGKINRLKNEVQDNRNAISYENLSTGVQTQISNLEKQRGIIKIRNDSSLNATLALPYDIYYRDVLSGSTTMFTSGIVYPQTNDSNYYTLPTSSIYSTYITIEFENSEGTTIQNVVLVNATQFSLSANKRILTIVLTNTGYASENITVKVTVETVET
jgi:hypothetical protein